MKISTQVAEEPLSVVDTDDIFLLKQRLAEQEALIHALQEKLSNREREIDPVSYTQLTRPTNHPGEHSEVAVKLKKNHISTAVRVRVTHRKRNEGRRNSM
ncbi:hypothetical protein, partial [Escherichia coli]|uniref:hypothetical protein n=1 Tax=Escherichia coli TaxID=562 RepID=UPI000AAC7419